MSNSDIGGVVLALSVLIFAVHILGYLFERIWQPRLVGEILAGVLVGPYVLGKVAPHWFGMLFTSGGGSSKVEVVLGFVYWIGLLLLMFLSGTETRRLMAKENQRQTIWLLSVGTTLPFFVVLLFGLCSLLPIGLISGAAQEPVAALLILAIAVAVTSIPVISRIFMDLGIMHTRFASLMLGFAVLEDIILWAVLAIATALVGSSTNISNNIISHIFVALAYMALGVTVIPKLLRRVHDSRWNILIQASPVGYLFFILFMYAAVAAMLNVNLVFSSFLAGFGTVGGINGSDRVRFATQIESISRVAKGVFIPIYFAMVGYKLIWGRDFSFSMLAVFLIISSLIALISFGLAAILAGFRGSDVVNLAITKNARGGPGIVLASIAYEAKIINAAFYTTLVLTAVLTSQAAGIWLRYILSRGRPLLSESDGKAPFPNITAEVERRI